MHVCVLFANCMKPQWLVSLIPLDSYKSYKIFRTQQWLHSCPEVLACWMQSLTESFWLGKATLILLFVEISWHLSWNIKIQNVMSFCLEVLVYSVCFCQLRYTVVSLKNLNTASSIILKEVFVIFSISCKNIIKFMNF